jgi:hypothetical protein
MDDSLEDKAPKAKAAPRSGSSRKKAKDAPVAKARSASAKRTEPEEARPARKATAQRKARAGGETTAKPAAARKGKAATAIAETKPAAKRGRTPVKAKQAKRPPSEAPAELTPAPAVSVHAKALSTEPQPHALAELPQADPHSLGPAGDVAIHPVEPHVPGSQPHDEGLEFGLSPVDLAPDASVREEAGLGWFIRILALSSVLLVLFNSFAIDKWSREQPVTKLNSQVLIAAHQLHAEMKSLHLDAPLEDMRSVWHGIRDARWPGSAGSREKTVKENPPA